MPRCSECSVSHILMMILTGPLEKRSKSQITKKIKAKHRDLFCYRHVTVLESIHGFDSSPKTELIPERFAQRLVQFWQGEHESSQKPSQHFRFLWNYIYSDSWDESPKLSDSLSETFIS